jgi:hypothetical protein
VLEEAQSDVLILLDCCAGGAVNTLEGNGVTELIAACGYNAIANGVGQYSFTNALILELLELSNKPSFSVSYLYNNIFTRIQGRMPEDGRERHPPPIHLVLTQESQLPRSIQLSKCSNSVEEFELEAREMNSTAEGERPDREDIASPGPLSVAGSLHSQVVDSLQNSIPAPPSTMVTMVPRLAFAIRLSDTLRPSQLRTDLFLEWLRSVPTIAKEVKVEAVFGSFSSLVILSIPVALSAFLQRNRAIISLGPITSRNIMLPLMLPFPKPGVIHSWTTPSKPNSRQDQVVPLCLHSTPSEAEPNDQVPYTTNTAPL